MIFEMGKRLVAGAGIITLVTLMGCGAKQDAASPADVSSTEAEPATLGSMDEQYAWVGDLGDRDALPGSSSTSKIVRGATKRRSTKRLIPPGWN